MRSLLLKCRHAGLTQGKPFKKVGVACTMPSAGAGELFFEQRAS